jgi:hypothetical protein
VNRTKFFFVPAQTVLILGGLLTLSGYAGYVDGPRGEIAAAPSAFVAQDDYVYYPNYGIYYSGSRHQYASLEAGAWVAQPEPRGVSIDVLRESPSVKMDFHDSPANHHAAVARQYPKNWKPSASHLQGDNRGERGGR